MKYNKTTFSIVVSSFIFLLSCSIDDNPSVNNEEHQSFNNFTPPLIGAHRGLPSYPENTYEGIEAAIKAGFKMIEFDVRITKDDVLVLQHDKTIDRCSNGTGEISEMNYKDLLQYDFGYKFGEQFRDTKISTLLDVLLLLKRNKCMAEIDMTSSGTDDVIKKVYYLVDSLDMLDLCAFNVMYYKGPLINELNERAHMTVSAADEDLPKVAKLCSSNHRTFLSRRKTLLTDSIIDYCRKNGILIEVWQVANEEELEEYKRKGCEYILTEFLPTFN